MTVRAAREGISHYSDTSSVLTCCARATIGRRLRQRLDDKAVILIQSQYLVTQVLSMSPGQ